MAEGEEDILGDAELNLWEEELARCEGVRGPANASGVRKAAKKLKTVFKGSNSVEPANSNHDVPLGEVVVPQRKESRDSTVSGTFSDSRSSSALPRPHSQAISEFTSEVSILDHDGGATDETEIHIDTDKPERKSKRNCLTFLCPSRKNKSWILNPDDSSFLFFWLTTLTLAVVYNLWTIIVRGTFTELQTKYSSFWFALDYLSDVAYLIDTVICFHTGYNECGVFVQDVRQLARRYSRTWRFVLDIVSILPLDFFYLSIGVCPFLRINRLCKLYRVVEFHRMVELRAAMPNFWRMANIVHAILVVVHYNGCFYYLVSEHEGFGELTSSWAYPDPSIHADFQSLSRKYLYSVYWSALSLTTVSGLPSPETDQQYMFSILQCILGVFILAFIIGQVTHIVVNRNTGKTEYERVLQRTRCFMQHRKVPKSTQLKVQRFYDYVWSSGQFHILDESEVLRLLPTEMKTELALKGNLIALEKVSLFQGCDSGLLRDLVLKLKHQMYSPGDYVCRSGDLGREMFIVSTGKLQVISSSEEEIRTIGEGAIFGEISVLNLNRGSRRTTDVISKGYSELFILTNTDVLDTLQNYPRARDIISQQSRRRLQEQLNRVRSFDGSDAGFPSRRGSSRVYRDPFPGRSRKSSARLRKISRTSSNQSRDSGFMSTSGHSTLSSAPSGRISMSPMVEEVTTDMTERLQNIYEQNTRALKSSLEHVLDHEVKYLRQRLHDTEMERDCKQREISQLKNQIGKLRHPDRDHVSDEKHETNTGED